MLISNLESKLLHYIIMLYNFDIKQLSSISHFFGLMLFVKTECEKVNEHLLSHLDLVLKNVVMN
jgi:hypothetical protein